MSGTAKARNKARARRGQGRTVEERSAVGTATLPGRAPAPPSGEPRGAVPAPRPVPGAALPPQGQAHGQAQGPAQGQVRLSVVADPPVRPEEARFGQGGSFARGYAAPADAVRCAMLGSPPTFWFDGDAGRLTVAVESGRLVAAGVAHIGEDLAELVAAVLLNHEGETADAVEPMRAALAELAALAGFQDGVEVTVDLSGPSPRLGWLSRLDPAPWVTWHDWWAAFAASPAGRTAAAYAAAGAGSEVDACFARQGLRVVRCAEPGCAGALTDRHPVWPGVWSAAGGTLGPVCAAAGELRAWPAGLLTAAPHRVAEA